ncbi:MAG: S49 family peptidase [Phycisphaerales bacterium]
MQIRFHSRSLVRAAAAALALAAAPLAVAQARLGYINIEGGLLDREPPAAMFFGGGDELTTRDVIGAIEDAAQREEIRGLVLRLTVPTLSGSQIDELGEAIAAFKRSGKKVHVFTEIYDRELLRLASFADEVIVQSGGGVMITGMHMEGMFLADSLENMGMRFQRVMVGDYKGAMEELTLSEPSEAYNQMLDTLLDGLYNATTSQITRGRGMDLRQLETAMASGFLRAPQWAISKGLVDAELDRLDLRDHLAEAYGDTISFETNLGTINAEEGPDFASMGFFESFAYFSQLFSGASMGSEPTRETIAVLHIKGPIMDGKSSQGGLFGGATVGSITTRQTIKELQDNDLVKGVVVRIDSPGGSAIASESIWLGLRALSEHKPVWVSVADMAASGGYYIAVGGDRIYANPHSIVGSIGVVGGKLIMSGLYDMIEANIVSRQRGPGGDIMSVSQEWSPRQQDLIREMMSEIYDQFLARVKAGRPEVDPSKAAAGRLFVGEQALALGMIDEVGGLDRAIEDMRVQLALGEDDFDVMDYPRPKSFEEMLEGMFSFAAAPQAAATEMGAQAIAGGIEQIITETLGPEAWNRVRTGLGAMQLYRTQPVGVVCPTVIIVR